MGPVLPGAPPPGSLPPPGAGAAASRPPRPLLNRIRTEGFAGYAVAYSPFFPATLAVASSANFGLVGNGRLHVCNLGAGPARIPGGGLPDKRFDTQDGLYDLAWSEVHENQIATASGDGSIKLWDVALNDFPIRNWHEHTREVFCVDWSNLRKELFASSSWDHTIKIWTPDRPHSVQTIQAHNACVYNSLFSPHSPDTLASCSSDGLLKIWDLKQVGSSSALPTGVTPAPAERASLTIPAHPTEVLSLDWNKYQPNIIATASVDRSVRIHDLRMASSSSSTSMAAMDAAGRSCIATLLGHDYAIRRVAWSPHHADVLATSGYDMTARTWRIDGLAQIGLSPPGTGMAIPRCTDVYDSHQEFVLGLGWSLFEPGVLATASWDHEVHAYLPNIV